LIEDENLVKEQEIKLKALREEKAELLKQIGEEEEQLSTPIVNSQ